MGIYVFPGPPGPGTVKSYVACSQDLGFSDNESSTHAAEAAAFHQCSRELKDLSFQVLAIDPLLCVRASVTSKTSFSWVLKAWCVFHLLVLLRLGPHPAPSQAGCRIPEIRALCWAGGDCFFCAPASTAVPKWCRAAPHFSKWSVQIRD